MASHEIVGQHADGEYFQAADLENLIRAAGGYGVLTDSITATITNSDMNVTLPAFNYLAPDGSGGVKRVEFAGDTITVSAADSDDPRNDICVARDDGTVEMVDGTATAETGAVADAPMPDLPSDAIMLFKVRVKAGATAIATTDVFPRAIDVSESFPDDSTGPAIPQPDFACATSVTEGFSSNTTARVTRVFLPRGKQVSQVTMEATAAGVAGTLAFGVFSEDGQTRHINDATASISGAGTVTTDVTDVYLPAGVYYLMAVSQSTANVTMRAYSAGNSIGLAAPANEDEISGTVTVTAGTIPSTFDPDTDVTYADDGAPIMRFD